MKMLIQIRDDLSCFSQHTTVNGLNGEWYKDFGVQLKANHFIFVFFFLNLYLQAKVIIIYIFKNPTFTSKTIKALYNQ